MQKQFTLSNLLRWFCLAALVVIFVLNTLHLLKSDILYHTDVARDFLIMHDIVETQKLPLIGPRSGVSGIFHGPAWYYLNLPVFVLSQGNPVAIGIYWWTIFWASLAVFYQLTKKIFSKDTALLATTLYAAATLFMPAGLSNWHPALFLTIVSTYFSWLYLTQTKPLYLALGLFFIGIVIQFEMAFGVPLLLVTAGYSVLQIFKKQQYRHLWAFLILSIPLSTFLLFDLRHDWLQIKAALEFVTSDSGPFQLREYLWGRFQAIADAFSLLKTNELWLRASAGALTIAAFFLSKKYVQKKPQWRVFWLYSILIVFGFWLLTIPYKDHVWEFYYRNLLPLIAVWAAFFVIKSKNIFLTLLAAAVIAVNVFHGLQSGQQYWQSPIDHHEVYWRFYQMLANDVLRDSNGEFGFYVFTTDQFGYQAKFGLQYQNRFAGLTMHENTKFPVTYLIVGPNDRMNPWANEVYWKEEQVKINRAPDKTWSYEAGYTVEKYLLSEEELAVPSDPNLITGTYFR